MKVDLASGELLDPHNGRADLARRIVQMIDAANFDDDPLRMSRWALDARPRDYGAFAPEILDVAGSGDARALEIVGEAAAAIAALANALSALGAERIALVGGFGEPLRPFLPSDVAKLLFRPRRDAVDGAILLAGGTLAEDASCP